MQIKGKKILVVGLARSGAAIAFFLKNQGAIVTVTDKAAPKDLGSLASEMEAHGIECELGFHNTETFIRSDLIVLSPGVPHTIPYIKQAKDLFVPVIGEVELASKFIDEPIIAITGTNGKTTTTTLISLMLEASGFNVFTGGNIGIPLITYADMSEESKKDGYSGDFKKCDYVVVELSSFQLDTIETFRPHIATLLNITDDHLDRYTDFSAYARSKGRIFENQTIDDIAIINGDDKTSLDLSKVLQNRKYIFGAKGSGYSAVICRNKITFNLPDKETFTVDLSNSKLFGKHNGENIAAAALTAISAGCTVEAVEAVIATFKGLPNRIEYVDSVKNIDCYNDSKATNIDAVQRALEAFNDKVVLIMGGRNKGGNFLRLKDAVKNKAREIFVIGESASEISETLGRFVKTTEVGSLEEATEKACKKAHQGDCVLFSPACSSFDMFNNYEHRGDVFRNAVRLLKVKSNG